MSSLFSAALLYIGSHQMGALPPLGSFFSPFHGFWKNAETDQHADLQLKIDGLAAPVKVVMDDRLVPHIYAQTKDDAFMAQGYLHAKYRLWQMDLTNRATLGRLSEILGDRTLEYDKTQRRLGLPLAAKNVYREWQKETEVNRLMQAYTHGVNAYIEQLKPADYPLEYKLLNYEPEKYDAFNIAVLYISMANVLCSFSLDIEQTNNLNWLGRDQFDNLFPDFNPSQSPIIPSGHIWDYEPVFKDEQTVDAPVGIGVLEGENDHPHSPELGSNNWVIGPEKSASGNAILCNDPHLNLTLPSVWYENHMVTPDLNVYGVSFPGAPGVIIGFNEDIAWGTTNGGHDVMDWYQIKWADKDKEYYYLDEEKRKTQINVEEIHVKGGTVVYDTILNTHWGPVWNKGAHDVSLKWVIHNDLKSNSFTTFIELNSAKNYKDYRTALQNFEAPIQNLVFADKKGDIALTVQGKFPIRSNGDGGQVLDGSDMNKDWKGFIPNEHLPTILNPQQGYVASANQHSTDDSYPYYYHGKFEDYRGRVVNKLISEKEKITVEDCKDFQNSNYSIVAKELTQAILIHIDDQSLSSFELTCKNLLLNWDYNFNATEKTPVIFVKLRNEINRILWDEFEHRTEQVVMPEIWRTIEILNSEDDFTFVDNKSTPEKERKSDLCSVAFKNAIQGYSSIQEISPWHKHKSTTIGHLAHIDAFSVDVPTDGYAQALNAQTATTGPSWRMIVEMGDPIKAYGVYPGGQSGNPGSPHFSDMIDEWSAGKYFELQFANSPDDLAHKSFEISFNK